jgi:hypothetical protein
MEGGVRAPWIATPTLADLRRPRRFVLGEPWTMMGRNTYNATHNGRPATRPS